jgi:hypothetical protein
LTLKSIASAAGAAAAAAVAGAALAASEGNTSVICSTLEKKSDFEFLNVQM